MPYDTSARSRRRSPSIDRDDPSASRHPDRSRDTDRHRKPHRRRSQSQSPRRNRSRDRDGHSHKSRRIRSPDYRSSRHHIQSPSRSRSRSPPRHSKHHRRSRSNSPGNRKPLPSQLDSYAIIRHPSRSPPPPPPPPPPKEEPNFAPSGLLAKEANTVAGTNIVLKYHEPPDSRKPPSNSDWRLFTFKGSEEIEPPIPLSLQTCWLFGRERAVADVWIQHPSASKQHAVIQFRGVTKKSEDEYDQAGKRVVKLYVIDLDSSNGTRLNGEKIPGRRFVEVRTRDILKIGSSEREYVFMQAPKE